MRPFNLILGSLLLLALLLPNAWAEDGVDTSAPDHPYLWRIPGAVDSWAFGTIHLANPRVTNFHPRVLEALDGAAVVYTEIPMDAATMAKAMQAMQLPRGKSLREIIGPDLHQRLDAELRTINRLLSAEVLDRMKVWVASAALVGLRDQMAYPGQLNVDQRIWRRGSEEGREARALETLDEQLGVFDNLSQEQQVEMLEQTLDQLQDMRQQERDPLDELITLYRSGRTDNILEYFLEWSDPEDPQTKAFMDAILTTRNIAMAERMAKFLQEEPERSHFFAVGAAHFADGPEGIPALLAEKGIAMERILAPEPEPAAAP